MKKFSVSCCGKTWSIEAIARDKIGIFPSIEQGNYVVRSTVDEAGFDEFLLALYGLPVDVTSSNIGYLKELSKEFQFHGLDAKFREFEPAPKAQEDPALVAAELQRRISLALEGQILDMGQKLLRMEEKLREMSAMEERLLKVEQENQRLKQWAWDTFRVNPFEHTDDKSSSQGFMEHVCERKSDPFDGILSSLRKVKEDKLEFRLISCGSLDPKFGVDNILSPGSPTKCYCSRNMPCPWFTIEFLETIVCPTCYSIRTYDAPTGAHHMQSWKIDMSLDNKTWFEIAREENSRALDGPSRVGTFKVKECDRRGRFLRFTMTTPNIAGMNFMYCSAFELFGTFMKKEDK